MLSFLLLESHILIPECLYNTIQWSIMAWSLDWNVPGEFPCFGFWISSPKDRTREFDVAVVYCALLSSKDTGYNGMAVALGADQNTDFCPPMACLFLPFLHLGSWCGSINLLNFARLRFFFTLASCFFQKLELMRICLRACCGTKRNSEQQHVVLCSIEIPGKSLEMCTLFQ